MAEVSLTFQREKDTKHTVRYQEVERPGKPLVVGSLYVQKWFAEDAATLTVTVSTGEIKKKR